MTDSLREKLHAVMRESCRLHEIFTAPCEACHNRVEGVLGLLEGKRTTMERKPLKKKTINLPVIPTKMTKRDKRWHRDFSKQIGNVQHNSDRLYYDLQLYRVQAWREAVRAFEANPDSFYNAYYYLNGHPVFWTFHRSADDTEVKVHERNLIHDCGIHGGLDLFVTRVDPDTGTPSEDQALNTRTEIRYELSMQVWPTHETYPSGFHATNCDGGAQTYEEAVIKAARKIHKLYGNDRAKLDADIAAWSVPTVADAAPEPDYDANLAAWEQEKLAEETGLDAHDPVFQAVLEQGRRGEGATLTGFPEEEEEEEEEHGAKDC